MPALCDDTMAAIADVMSLFDKKGDGKIDINKIVDCLRALDLNPNSWDWNGEIANLKKQGKYRIDLEEFSEIYAEEASKGMASHDDLVQSLKALDPIGGECGVINRVELKHYLTMIGDKLTDEEAETILEAVAAPSKERERGDRKNVNVNQLIKLVTGNLDDE